MVFVMVQGSKVRGVFDSIFHARCFFSDTTGTPYKDIKEQVHINGDTLLLVNNYVQARLKQTKFY